ncbi:hypothetical protein Y032_0026g1413 [Ancylostoma ceylanicum]|uniref:Uncharacterized protein n=1 Tax=Ancylostoma ceylanicum TaxID=53326 RepID=A0A016UUI6_9BILA|nr:hypothetical protein Y032_0026g1413 [Ancylostoma ceylanicum]
MESAESGVTADGVMPGVLCLESKMRASSAISQFVELANLGRSAIYEHNDPFQITLLIQSSRTVAPCVAVSGDCERPPTLAADRR